MARIGKEEKVSASLKPAAKTLFNELCHQTDYYHMSLGNRSFQLGNSSGAMGLDAVSHVLYNVTTCTTSRINTIPQIRFWPKKKQKGKSFLMIYTNYHLTKPSQKLFQWEWKLLEKRDRLLHTSFQSLHVKDTALAFWWQQKNRTSAGKTSLMTALTWSHSMTFHTVIIKEWPHECSLALTRFSSHSNFFFPKILEFQNYLGTFPIVQPVKFTV